jgi:hypothetical protein
MHHCGSVALVKILLHAYIMRLVAKLHLHDAMKYSYQQISEPVTVAVLSKAWTVFSRLSTGIVGSDPTWGMDVSVCLFCVCIVLCIGSGLETGWLHAQVLPTV